MSQPATNVGFSPTTPAAPAGFQNVVPQSDNGAPFQTESFNVPNTGGVAAKTANYTATAADCGKLLSFNSSSAIALTLPATAPFAQWNIGVQNIGSGTLTVSRNGLLIDTAAANLTLGQNSGVQISTDGTNYFSERGAASTAGLATKSDVQQEAYTYAADTGSANAYAVTLSPTPTIVAGSVVVFKAANANTGGSTLAVNGGGAVAIKKDGATALSAGDISMRQIVCCVYDGTNYQAIGLAPAQVLTPIIRGSGLVDSGSASSLTISFPSGTLIGDLAVISFWGDFNPTTPASWTSIFITSGNTYNVMVAWKILTSGDISAGTVTVNMAGTQDCALGIVTFIGPTGGIREFQSNPSGFAISGPITNVTSGAVLNTDVALYFASVRSGSATTPPVVTPASGSANTLQSHAVSVIATILADQTMPGGALSVTDTTAGGGAGFWAIQVIVEGVASGVGSVTSVGLTVSSRQSVSGSPIVGAGTFVVTDNTQNANLVFAGPSSGAAAAPTFRAIVPADVPVFVASGSGHAAGAVPDPGASAGTTRFLREDATFAMPTGAATHSESLTDGASNFIFAGGDIVTVVGVPN